MSLVKADMQEGELAFNLGFRLVIYGILDLIRSEHSIFRIMNYAHRLVLSLSFSASVRTFFLILACCSYLFSMGQKMPRPFDVILDQVFEARSDDRINDALVLIDSARVMATTHGDKINKVSLKCITILVRSINFRRAITKRKSITEEVLKFTRNCRINRC